MISARRQRQPRGHRPRVGHRQRRPERRPAAAQRRRRAAGTGRGRGGEGQRRNGHAGGEHGSRMDPTIGATARAAQPCNPSPGRARPCTAPTPGAPDDARPNGGRAARHATASDRTTPAPTRCFGFSAGRPGRIEQAAISIGSRLTRKSPNMAKAAEVRRQRCTAVAARARPSALRARGVTGPVGRREDEIAAPVDGTLHGYRDRGRTSDDSTTAR